MLALKSHLVWKLRQCAWRPVDPGLKRRLLLLLLLLLACIATPGKSRLPSHTRDGARQRDRERERDREKENRQTGCKHRHFGRTEGCPMRRRAKESARESERERERERGGGERAREEEDVGGREGGRGRGQARERNKERGERNTTRWQRPRDVHGTIVMRCILCKLRSGDGA